MKKGSILIISNDKEIGEQIQGKLKLLRECDASTIVPNKEAMSVLNSTQPSIIIVYNSDSDNIGIVKEIRSMKALDKVPVLFVMDSFEQEQLMFAFDNGIDDFFFMNDDDSVILMRVLLVLQKAILYKQLDINNEILVAADIIDRQTGIYKKEQAPIALRNFFSQSLEENLEHTVFMYLKVSPLFGKKLNMAHISEVVRRIPRADDIVAYGRSNGFYIILYNTGAEGSKAVAGRIKKSLSSDCKVNAVAAEITASFEEMEPVLYQSMKDQIDAEDEDFNFIYDMDFKEVSQVMDIKDKEGHKLKDFKKDFLNSFEKIVAPVFYQIQSSYSQKFPNANIDFSINETESKFIIKQEDLSSELSITYPAYIKLLMDIKHFDGDNPPVVRRLSFDFEDFSAEKLDSILKDVIKEFSGRLSMKIMSSSETL